MRLIALAISMLIVASMQLLSGCDSDTADPVAADSRPTTTVESGPVRITATASSDQINIAQRVECVIRATAPSAYEIEFPTFTDRLGEYTIVESSLAPPALAADGKLEWALSLLLEPFLPGVYEVEPIDISVRESSLAEPSLIQLVLPLVTVASVLDDSPESASIGELKAALDPPVPQPTEESPRTMLVAIGVVAAVLVCGFAWLLIRRGRSTRSPDPCRAALTDLVALAGTSAISEHDVDIAFGAVRTCLSKTVDPAAASLTASQLLDSVGVRRLLSSDDQSSLGDCLRRFERMQYAPEAASASTMRETISEAARLAAILVQTHHDQHSTHTNGHAVGGAA